MSASWRDDDEEFRVGGVKGALRAKPRFSFTEVKLLLEAVKRNRYIILRKFNQGVSAETKKQTWAEITDQINGLGENHREVRQIMKKWADLKCDGKRRVAALRGPNGSNVRKKNMGPVERMVHKILMMSPRGDGDSDPDLDDEDFSKFCSKGPPSNPSPYSYLSLTDSSHSLPGGASLDISPLSSPEKEPSELGGDYDENDSMFSSYHSPGPPPSSTSLDPLPDDALLRVKPVYTYSRNNNSSGTSSQTQNQTSSAKPPPGPSPTSSSSSSTGASTSDAAAAAPPPAPPLTNSTSQPAPSSSSNLPPPAPAPTSSSASNSHPPPPPLPPPPPSSLLPPKRPSVSYSHLSDPLPAGASSSHRDNVAQLSSQSLQQQRASRMLLTSVSQSLEVLAQSVQLLVESQQEFVQESLLLQRETVDILRDFSGTALAMLRDKSAGGGGGGGGGGGDGPASTVHHYPGSRF